MMGLFKKKEKKESGDSGEEYRAFAADFLPEELTVLAVTGASGFNGGKADGDRLWTAGIELTAWMEEDSPDIHQGSFQLTSKVDEKLLDYLRQRVPRDFIIQCRVRISGDGKRLLLLDLPKPGFDPDLKAILEEQKKPVTFWAEALNTYFTLNRSAGWFETELLWLERPIQLTFDPDEDREDCLEQAKTLLGAQEDWDRRIRAFAAQELLALANEWAGNDSEDEDEDAVPITQDQFMARMELESIQLRDSGEFDFWFSDGDLFYGHSICVSGGLAQGPVQAQMEG